MTARYTSYKTACLNGTAPNLLGVTVKVMATADSLGAFNAAHDFLDDVSALRYPGTTDQTLAAKTITGGVFDSTDPVFSSVALSGATVIDALILYVDTGTPGTSMLLARYDAFTPVTPNGSNVTVSVNAAGWL